MKNFSKRIEKFVLGNFSQIQILAICSQFQVLIETFVVFTVQNNSLFNSVIFFSRKVEKNSKLHNFQSIEKMYEISLFAKIEDCFKNFKIWETIQNFKVLSKHFKFEKFQNFKFLKLKILNFCMNFNSFQFSGNFQKCWILWLFFV